MCAFQVSAMQIDDHQRLNPNSFTYWLQGKLQCKEQPAHTQKPDWTRRSEVLLPWWRQTHEPAKHRWKLDSGVASESDCVIYRWKIKITSNISAIHCMVVFRVSWHLSTFRLLLRCPLFSCVRFSCAHFVRESNQILFHFSYTTKPQRLYREWDVPMNSWN